MDYIPVVDLSKITSETTDINSEDFKLVAEKVFEALSGIGFVYLKNHGVNKEIIEKAFAESRSFFELPETEKVKNRINLDESYNNGYNKQGLELQSDGTASKGYRETYDFNGNNRVHPDARPKFGPSLKYLEDACKPLTKILLRVLASSMNLDDIDYFINRFKWLDDVNVKTYTTLRSLFYPKIPDNVPAGTVRCGKHTDYGIITLLFQDEIGGLEVKSVGGKWISAIPIPETILVNTGDLLEFWSGGKFPATCHQVLIPEKETKRKTHRQSIALFVHPDADVVVSPLLGKLSEYSSVVAIEHANYKLAESYMNANAKQ